MDVSRLSQAEKTVIGGAIIVLIGGFQPWYQVAGLGIGGWRTGFGSLGLLAVLGGAAIVILKAFELSDVGRGTPGMAERLALMLMGVGAGLSLLQLLAVSAFVGRGLYITLAGAGIAAYGTYQAMQEAVGSGTGAADRGDQSP